MDAIPNTQSENARLDHTLGKASYSWQDLLRPRIAGGQADIDGLA